MEFCDSGTLLDYVAKGVPLPFAVLTECFRQTASAVAYVHASDIVHFDLKLENIFIAKDPGTGASMVKVGDFGLAMRHCATSSSPSAPQPSLVPHSFTQPAKQSPTWNLGHRHWQMNGRSASTGTASLSRASTMSASTTNRVANERELQHLHRSISRGDGPSRGPHKNAPGPANARPGFGGDDSEVPELVSDDEHVGEAFLQDQDGGRCLADVSGAAGANTPVSGLEQLVSREYALSAIIGGTAPYQPPECFSDDASIEDLGPEVDVWALGCALYEAVTCQSVPLEPPYLGQLALSSRWPETWQRLYNTFAEGLQSMEICALANAPLSKGSFGTSASSSAGKASGAPSPRQGARSDSTVDSVEASTSSSMSVDRQAVLRARDGFLSLLPRMLHPNPAARPTLANISELAWLGAFQHHKLRVRQPDWKLSDVPRATQPTATMTTLAPDSVQAEQGHGIDILKSYHASEGMPPLGLQVRAKSMALFPRSSLDQRAASPIRNGPSSMLRSGPRIRTSGQSHERPDVDSVTRGMSAIGGLLDGEPTTAHWTWLEDTPSLESDDTPP